MLSRLDLVVSCIGGFVGYVGLTYIAGPWFKYVIRNQTNLLEDTQEEDNVYTENTENTKNKQHKQHQINHLRKHVKLLKLEVSELEHRNDSLRHSNRQLTKLANSTANITFNHQRKLCKKNNSSPHTREGIGLADRDLIFVDYPSCEFSILKASSNEI